MPKSVGLDKGQLADVISQVEHEDQEGRKFSYTACRGPTAVIACFRGAIPIGSKGAAKVLVARKAKLAALRRKVEEYIIC